MKKRLLIIIWIFGAINIAAKAHTSLNGIVMDAETGRSLPGAFVVLENTKQHAVTNDLGYFSFNNAPDSILTLSISYIGYETLNIKTRAEDGLQKFTLQPTVMSLPAVNIRPELSANTALINQMDIKARPIRNAQEILQIVPGLMIAQHAGGGKAEQIFLRGFDIDHGTDIALSVDGIPVNMVSHAHGQGYADLHFIIPELIDDVDYQKGTYDASIGNFATAGAIQFNTLNTLSDNFVKLEAGQYNTFRAVAGLQLIGGNNAEQKEKAYIASAYEFSDGYFEASQNFFRFNMLGKYQNQITDTEIIRLGVSTFASEWDASGQIPERAVKQGLISRFGAIDDTEGGQTSRTNINVEHIKMLTSHSVLQTQAYYTRYQFLLFSNFTFFDQDPINGDQIRQQENRHLLGLNTSLVHDHELFNMPSKLEGGIQMRFDAIQDNELSRTLNREATLSRMSLGDVRETNVGVFLSESFRITDRLQSTIGTRMDFFRFQYEDKLVAEYNPLSETKSILSPKLNMSYRLSRGIQFNLQSGLGFHSNDTRVVVAQEGLDILPRAYETEFTAITKPSDHLIATIGLWRLRLDQEFVYVGDEGIVEPSGESLRKGIDASIRYQPFQWLQMDTDVNYVLPRAIGEEDGADYIPLAPIFTSTGGVKIDVQEGFGLSLRYRYMDQRPANEDYTITANGYFLLDAAVHYRKNKIEVGFSAQNLLNEEWKEAQFATTSRLQGEPEAVTEIHYTPGSPFFARAYATWYF